MVIHRAEDGAGAGKAGVTTIVPESPDLRAATGAPAGRSTPKGNDPRLGPRTAGLTGRCLTWAVPDPRAEARSLERR